MDLFRTKVHVKKRNVIGFLQLKKYFTNSKHQIIEVNIEVNPGSVYSDGSQIAQ
jgi:hypothetical protein